ncbi:MULTISPECIES: hypothetical protein [Rhizobium]|uniref:hypothetical protein n=1 Tax=Rhizobium TaxID=379 RepID=UPI001FE0E92B|nr:MULTISPECIES: hypothetical protein [Rhizobium]WSH48689.1 hypothetical protein U8P77_35895 [Rhizobium johnstonii]
MEETAMNNPTLRFDVILMPTEKWMVWDDHHEAPATFGGEILSGLHHEAAARLADILNEVYPRTTGQSPRASNIR